MGLFDFGGFGSGLGSRANNPGANERQGSLCPAKCLASREQCRVCKRLQDEAVAALQDYAELERRVYDARQNPAAAQKLPAECELCGAPIEKGALECPYCATEYPAAASAGSIPSGIMEQEEYLLDNAAAAYLKYSEWEDRRIKAQMSGGGAIGVLSKVMGATGIMDKMSEMLKMDGRQIRQGAQHYGVSYSDYIIGITNQTYKPLAQLNMERAQQSMNEQSARNQQIEAERQARLRQIRQEENERQARMSNMRSSGYSYAPGGGGGSGGNSGNYRTCGNCALYNTNSAECSRDGRRRNATEYCAWFSLK